MELNKIFNVYLEKNGFRREAYLGKQDFIPELALVIPCYKEGDISPTLYSIYKAYQYEAVPTVVLVIVNAPENADQETLSKNEMSVQSILDFMFICNKEKNFRLDYLIFHDVPIKVAGVGWARKKGFDEIIHRYCLAGADPILVWFDADSICDVDFLHQVHRSFSINPGWDAASVHFEHPIPQPLDNQGKAIVEYELHLRIYIHFQIYSGLPFAFQTIGSSMAVKATSYAKNGGMSPKKAGEDFYFLQKIGDKGTVGVIRETKVSPSGRISDRVPFGTGKAIGDKILNGKTINTYHPESYMAILPLWRHLHLLYEGHWTDLSTKLPAEVVVFCEEQGIHMAIIQIKQNSATLQSFQRRFFQWFNAFKYMKYLHYMRTFQKYRDCDVFSAFSALMKCRYPNEIIPSDTFDALLFLREKDKTGH